MDTIFDHPIIGGKLTIAVLMYGDYFEMHRECLQRIIDTTLPANRAIRVYGNALGAETGQFLLDLGDKNVICGKGSKANLGKYPAMRQLLYTGDMPPLDKWLVWFDDDSIVADDQWFTKLAEKIVETTDTRAKMVGDLAEWTFTPHQIAWMRTRPWFRGLPWQERAGCPLIRFCPGGFWAMETATMHNMDIPDPQLAHNGGDYMIGAQIWQAGFDILQFNENKRYVTTSAFPRRGLSEIHTGCPGWKSAEYTAL